jgi:thiol-disulfide isomerase/thioredoxin
MELLYFWKENCAPCKAAKPVVEQVAKDLNVTVSWLNVREPTGEAYITPFNLMAVPTLVVVKDKHKVADITGGDLQNATKLARQLDKLRSVL